MYPIYVLILILSYPVSTRQCFENFFHGSRFHGTVFETVSGSRLFSCAADCVAFLVCKSLSFDRNTNTCFLHLEEVSEHPGYLHNATGFSYSTIIDWNNVVLGPCQRNPCMVSQKCVVNRKRRRCIDMTTNLSLGKTTKASSSFHSQSDPAYPVDGNRSPKWNSNSCFHVGLSDIRGWWQVDLGARAVVTNVLIVNRGDCCGERFRNFDLETFTEDPSLVPTAEAHLCYRHLNEALAAGAAVTFNCTSALVGRYLRVSIHTPIDAYNIVQICEVEVYGWIID